MRGQECRLTTCQVLYSSGVAEKVMYLLWLWTSGRRRETDLSMAARTSMVDLRRAAWSADLLELFRVPAGSLPRLAPDSRVRARLDTGPVLGAILADQASGALSERVYHSPGALSRGNPRNAQKSGEKQAWIPGALSSRWAVQGGSREVRVDLSWGDRAEIGARVALLQGYRPIPASSPAVPHQGMLRSACHNGSTSSGRHGLSMPGASGALGGGPSFRIRGCSAPS